MHSPLSSDDDLKDEPNDSLKPEPIKPEATREESEGEVASDDEEAGLYRGNSPEKSMKNNCENNSNHDDYKYRPNSGYPAYSSKSESYRGGDEGSSRGNNQRYSNSYYRSRNPSPERPPSSDSKPDRNNNSTGRQIEASLDNVSDISDEDISDGEVKEAEVEEGELKEDVQPIRNRSSGFDSQNQYLNSHSNPEGLNFPL